jgi:hypothetical protein
VRSSVHLAACAKPLAIGHATSRRMLVRCPVADTFTLFEDTHYRGDRLELDLDDHARGALHSLRGSRVHDEVSSLRWTLRPQHWVTLYEHADGTGRSYRFGHGAGEDPSTHDANFKDCATSWRWARADVAPPVVAAFGWIRDLGWEARFDNAGTTVSGHIQGVGLIDDRTMLLSSSGTRAEVHVVQWTARVGVGPGRRIATHVVAPAPFDHAGGLQICDGIVAVGAEVFQARDRSRVVFWDMANPATPAALDHLSIDRPQAGNIPRRWTAGAVGMVRRGDRYLVVVGAWDSAHLDFYESSHGNLRDPACSFQRLASWSERNAMKLDWFDRKWAPYQSLSLFTRGSRVFLVGGHAPFFPRKDWIDLYELRLLTPEPTRVRKMAKRHLTCTGGASFLYGGGVLAHNGALHAIAIERDFHARTMVNIFEGPTPFVG